MARLRQFAPDSGTTRDARGRSVIPGTRTATESMNLGQNWRKSQRRSLFRRSLRGRTAAAAEIRSMVFEPSPADGAFRIQSGEVLAILERARCRRALRGLSVRRPGAARRSAQFRRLQNMLVAAFDQAWPH